MLYGGKNTMKKTIIVGSIICTLLITIMIPIVGANSTINEKSRTSTNSDLIDNFKINLEGTFPKDIFWNLITISRPDRAQYLMVTIENNNNVYTTMYWQLTITQKNGKTIYTDNHVEDGFPAKSSETYFFGLSRLDLIVNHYLVGPCTITYTLHIQQDGSEKTLTYNGYFHNFSLKIKK
jgi:hypothetical protein